MELFPLLENKSLHTLNLRDRSLFKRGLQHELSREIIGQERWRQQRGFVQTVAKRSFTLLQKKFQKDLNKIIKELSSGSLDITTVKRKSKKIFETYYKRAYLLGLKSSGFGIARAFSDLNFNFYGDPDIQHAEERWSRIATASELKFWDKYIEKLISQASSRFTLEKRVGFYVNSLEGHYNAGRVAGSPNNTLVHWILDKGHEPCKECEYLADNSPWPKDLLITTPKAGFCSCLMNCRCLLRIIPSTSSEYLLRKQELPNKNQIIKEISDI